MNFVKDKRKQQGLSQQGFADALGVSKSYIYQIEKGKRNLSDNLKQKIEALSKPAATDWNELLNAPECFDVVHALESGLGRRMLAADCERSVQSVLDEIRGRWVRQISDRAVGK